MYLSWPGAWVGCGLVAALEWDVFCCPACLVVAAVWCRASEAGCSVGSAPWVRGWLGGLVMCPPLCGVFWLCWAGWSAPFFGVGPHSWPLGRFWLGPFCWGSVDTSGSGLGNGAGDWGLRGWVVPGGGWGHCSRFSVGSRGQLPVPSFLPADVPMPPSFVGTRQMGVPIGVSRGAGSLGGRFAPQSFP
ncbi:hypothetical protein XENOCAPTIV_009059 [Xenoophorus captivus]|uniref:Secreted protein n=1 Tax=Xenoophorus captivus TaxID=1517983 RepID=A0ABV0SEA3_9TELE